MKKPDIIYLSLLAFLLYSCISDSFDVAPIIKPQANLSFDTNVLPIIKAYRCKNCHYSSSTSPNLTDANAYASLTTGTSYVNVTSASSSVFYQSVSNPNFSPFQMPDVAKLTENEQMTILEWITQGAKP